MKCKTFDAPNAKQLDEEVNNFLKENDVTLHEVFKHTTPLAMAEQMPAGLQQAGRGNVNIIYLHSLTILYQENK